MMWLIITRRDIEKLIIDYWKKERENPTINDVFNEWNDRRLMLNKICQSTHMRNQQYFERHFEKFGRLHIKNVTPEEIQDFLEELGRRGGQDLFLIVTGNDDPEDGFSVHGWMAPLWFIGTACGGRRGPAA